MRYWRYFLITLLSAIFAPPLTICITTYLINTFLRDMWSFSNSIFFLLYIALIIAILVFACMKYIDYLAYNEYLPKKIWRTILPIMIPFAYFTTVWFVFFRISGFAYDTLFYYENKAFSFYMFPYSLLKIYRYISLRWFPVLFTAIPLFLLFATLMTIPDMKNSPVFKKFEYVFNIGIVVILCFIVYSWIPVFIASIRSYSRRPVEASDVVGEDYGVLRVSDNTAVNDIVSMPWEPTVTINREHPVLDGATAMYPVYASVAQGLYRTMSFPLSKYVSMSRTERAYEHLFNREIDIFFGLEPSLQQMTNAGRLGVSYIMTPIAREAFVFFVNAENPVENLTVEEIQRIYTREITNWQEVGGLNERIMPFQRNENSGSQTIMLSAVMNGIPMTQPLMEENINRMSPIIHNVAEYRNYASAIGYSFRYYATEMDSNDKIKLLSINGIAPTVENIRNGTYPFIVNVYAITAGTTNENAQILIDWILSEQGQEFIELCGYVSVN